MRGERKRERNHVLLIDLADGAIMAAEFGLAHA
jgi:hypothetical protein